MASPVLSSKDMYFINLAYDAATRSTLLNFSVGACLHLKKKFYSVGSSNPRSKIGKYCITSTHAEMDAILRVKKVARRSTIYVVRISDMDGRTLNAKPCSHCTRILNHIGIRYCCWSTGDAGIPFKKTAVKNLEEDHLSNCQKKFLYLERHKGTPLF